MKLVAISISNVRSFRFDPTFQDEIKFGSSGLNLIIGPNASGKSNLIETIMQVFSTLYDIGGASLSGSTNLENIVRSMPSRHRLQQRHSFPGTFTKHKGTPNERSSIKLRVMLDINDISNLKNIRSRSSILANIFERYYEDSSSTERIFSSSFSIPATNTTYEIILDEVQEQHTSYFIERDQSNIAARYLNDYGLVCALIDTCNELLHANSFAGIERSNPTTHNYRGTLSALGLNIAMKPIPRLLPPVMLMSVQERLNDISLSYYPYAVNGEDPNVGLTHKTRQMEVALSRKSTQGSFNNSLSEAFEVTKSLIWNDCVSLIESSKTTSEVVTHVNKEHVLLKTFNEFIAHFGLSLTLQRFSVAKGGIELRLSEQHETVNMADISSGQRAIINIAAALMVGSRLQALVLIDEIENHLHPTVQSKLREALINRTGIISQSIAITHSPIFVTTNSLENTLRVYMKDGYSHVKRCQVSSRRNAKSIVNVLDYTNGARVFFTNKVLLVEGPSDQEFFSAYIKKWFKDPDIEVVAVGSKDQLKKWRQIIEDFGVKVWTIADLDAAKKGAIRTVSIVPKSRSLKWEDVDPREHPVLLRNIEAGASVGNFILRRGALEAYVPGSGGKIERVREFLTNDSWQELKHKREIKRIVREVISS